MKLWAWYAHSWYFDTRWLRTLEVGFDLRCWALGFYHRTGETGFYVGPIIVCHDRSLG